MSSGVSPPDGTTSDDSRTPTDQITSSEVKARLRAFDLRQEVLGASQALSSRSVIASSDSGQKPYLALVGRRDGELRSFLYDSGAHANVIGRENLTRAEIERIEVQPTTLRLITAAGPATSNEAVWLKVPHLGRRKFWILKSCPPCLSVVQDITDYGSILYWDSVSGPTIELTDGSKLHLELSDVIELNEGCVVTPPPGLPDTRMVAAVVDETTFQCTPCELSTDTSKLMPNHGATNSTSDVAGDTKSINQTARACKQCNKWSSAFASRSPTGPRERITAPQSQQTASNPQREALLSRKRRDSATSAELLVPSPHAKSTSPLHGNQASSTSLPLAFRNLTETPPLLQEFTKAAPPKKSLRFFLEVFSGTGRLSDSLRAKYSTDCIVLEFDLSEKGGSKNLLTKKVYKEVMDLIADPNCIGVWFGFPCATFSSARRHDGCPPPLRGFNSKDNWGLPGIKG